jgi:hypothetical protein
MEQFKLFLENTDNLFSSLIYPRAIIYRRILGCQSRNFQTETITGSRIHGTHADWESGPIKGMA